MKSACDLHRAPEGRGAGSVAFMRNERRTGGALTPRPLMRGGRLIGICVSTIATFGQEWAGRADGRYLDGGEGASRVSVLTLTSLFCRYRDLLQNLHPLPNPSYPSYPSCLRCEQDLETENSSAVSPGLFFQSSADLLKV